MSGLLKKRFGGLLATGWSFMRILRFATGTAALIFAVRNHDMVLGFAGGLLLFMAVFNFGCCAAGSCSVQANNPNRKTSCNEPEKNDGKVRTVPVSDSDKL